jgi:hypothetical protein
MEGQCRILNVIITIPWGFSLKIRDSLNEFSLVLAQVMSQALENILFSKIWPISPSENRLEDKWSRRPMNYSKQLQQSSF